MVVPHTIICHILAKSRLFYGSLLGTRRARGLCIFLTGSSIRSCRFASSAGVFTPLSSLPLLSLSSLPSASQSCCSLSLFFFFLAFLVSHPPSQSRPLLDLTMFVHPFASSLTALLVRSKDW